jgi:hypothetical protein
VTNVVLVDFMADVDDLRFRGNGEDDAVADGGRRVARAPVGEQAYEWAIPLARAASGGRRRDHTREASGHVRGWYASNGRRVAERHGPTGIRAASNCAGDHARYPARRMRYVLE